MNNIKINLLVLWSGILPFAFYTATNSHSSLSVAFLFVYIVSPILFFANDIIKFAYNSTINVKTQEINKKRNLNRREDDKSADEELPVEIDTWA